MFATERRKLTDEEAKQLCEKYITVHRYRMVRANEALFVDLRPAFSIPLSDVEPKESFPVPKDCIPELCQVFVNSKEIENASPFGSLVSVAHCLLTLVALTSVSR